MHIRPTGPTFESVAIGDPVALRDRDGAVRTVEIAERIGDSARPVVRFAGCDSREAAARLTGSVLQIDGEHLAPLADPDTYYVRDLVGCRVEIEGVGPWGVVVEVHSAPANDALEVETDRGSVLIPFIASAIVGVDLAARSILVRPGLVEGS